MRSPAEPVHSTQPALGIWTCSALVVGNMIGSGFFLSPTALAPFGSIAILGWVVIGIGAMCLGLVFARLAAIAPATGGPYAFTRMAFGQFAGFLVAWAYWISIWASLPAVAIGFCGYLAVFIPAIKQSKLAFTATAIAAIWIVALINMRGVKEAGQMQVTATALKIVPFILISTLGLFWVEPANLGPINPGEHSFFNVIALTAPITMFAFLGIESATVPAGHVENPKRTIPRATVLGTLLCLLIYVLGTLVVMGTVPREALLRSASPFADAATNMWGAWAGGTVALAVVISSLGALNGWTLMMTQVPMAAGRDGLFPQIFGRLSARGTPVYGIVISTSLASLLLILQTSGISTLSAVYSFIVELSTTAAMIPYVFCSLAEAAIFLSLAKAASPGIRIGPYQPVAIVAFIFSMLTVIGGGANAGLWCLLLLLGALPFYITVQRRRSSEA